MSPTEIVIKAIPPAFVTLEPPNEGSPVRCDLYAVRRVLQEAEKKPSEELRWSYILDWLAEQWKVDRSTLSENMAVHLNNAIMDQVILRNKELAEANFPIASSVESTAVAQSNTPTK